MVKKQSKNSPSILNSGTKLDQRTLGAPQYPQQPNFPQQPGYPRQPNYTQQPPPSGGAPSNSTYWRLDPDGVYRPVKVIRKGKPQRKSCCLSSGCGVFAMLAGVLILLMGFFTVLGFGKTNILVLGLDYVEAGSSAARSDTIVLTSFQPLKNRIAMVSVPRDLWVEIPGVGQNRINTAHFYAEANQPGSGPAAALETIEQNFQVDMDHTVRIRFEGFVDIVNAMGGVEVNLDEAMAGYEAGSHLLTGRKALAFVRDRANSDDFYRMSHGQIMLKALFKNLLNPLKWPRLPLVASAVFKAVDTDIPVWKWPSLTLQLLFHGPNGIETHIFGRELVTPFTTDQGASVLLPNWDLIRLLMKQVF